MRFVRSVSDYGDDVIVPRKDNGFLMPLERQDVESDTLELDNTEHRVDDHLAIKIQSCSSDLSRVFSVTFLVFETRRVRTWYLMKVFDDISLANARLLRPHPARSGINTHEYEALATRLTMHHELIHTRYSSRTINEVKTNFPAPVTAVACWG